MAELESVGAEFKAFMAPPAQPEPQKAEKHASNLTMMKPLTYEQAFEMIGGAAKLAEYAALSAQLQEKTSNVALDSEVR